MSDCKSRCKCFPYNDGLAIAAQVLSIIAFGVSAIAYLFLPGGVVGLVLQQILWCCRLNKCGMIATAVFSGLAGAVSLGGAIWLTLWRWWFVAIPLYVSAVLWFVSMGLTIGFVCTGRHARFEDKYNEMAASPQMDHPDMGTEQGPATHAELIEHAKEKV